LRGLVPPRGSQPHAAVSLPYLAAGPGLFGRRTIC